ncbi:hypothetical protein BDV26DRAFT_294090 [Aspergillus bertholletiae]|uniref:Uncharacterized protein n=1 Tax=Aspergillus bertholletiae TaxID=1226010 RepID=A0A5N7B2V9_9EURO|nr:hypothetical protein BDV26DRAFT_294090 [Aspergillus bertholletiae]
MPTVERARDQITAMLRLLRYLFQDGNKDLLDELLALYDGKLPDFETILKWPKLMNLGPWPESPANDLQTANRHGMVGLVLLDSYRDSFSMDPSKESDKQPWWAEVEITKDIDFDPLTDGDDFNKRTRFGAILKQLVQNGSKKVVVSPNNNSQVKKVYCICLGDFLKGETPTVEKGTKMILEDLENLVTAPAASSLEVAEFQISAKYWQDQHRRESRKAPSMPNTPRIGFLDDDDLEELREGFWG